MSSKRGSSSIFQTERKSRSAIAFEVATPSSCHLRSAAELEARLRHLVGALPLHRLHVLEIDRGPLEGDVGCAHVPERNAAEGEVGDLRVRLEVRVAEEAGHVGLGLGLPGEGDVAERGDVGQIDRRLGGVDARWLSKPIEQRPPSMMLLPTTASAPPGTRAPSGGRRRGRRAWPRGSPGSARAPGRRWRGRRRGSSRCGQ